MGRRRWQRYTWSYTWPQRWDRLEQPVAPWIAALAIFALTALLIWLTGRIWDGAPWTGFGFGLAGAGLLLTLLTRNSSSRAVWFFSVFLSTVGLIVALATFPASCDAECLAAYAR